ncbi:uncharacterized protein [Sinocyclocheilus grahami]|uniref:uncharacterized protein n=1 Tax=Sinocyclocheilus grahami TaxID=75366 RepID=UPI0007AD021A|nr:PREDICTED: uncharacterized protein LOC107570309 [Sinocyclocheilus grahami]XP_016112016.1 PREDICTED: uncharacterized protein LOC107570309 [Sinocyclocheilus grahami]
MTILGPNFRKLTRTARSHCLANSSGTGGLIDLWNSAGLRQRSSASSTSKCGMHLIKRAARVRRKTSSPGMMTLILYLGQNRTLIRWMLLSPMKVQHRLLPMMLASTVDQATASDTDVDDVTNTVADAGVSDDPSTESSVNEEGIIGGRLPIPGAKARKRKIKSCKADVDIQAYMMDNRMMLTELHRAEQSQVAQEAACFERILKEQREAEERRFQVMQAQQRATNQMFLQLMGTLASALNPGQPPPSFLFQPGQRHPHQHQSLVLGPCPTCFSQPSLLPCCQ